ncbi:Protein kinase domain-containing protein [Aphelenchoides bicaudatus]|nr:Protein kinase domain-containing protein [Aphelenchoides bicaudatus]
MEYLNKFRSTVSSTANSIAAQVTQALPGNPIFREYDVKNPVSIWLFEKRQIEKWPKHEKEAFPELLKRGVNQLTRLRHPRILTIDRTLEESRDSFAFCTEPVFASLANVFGDKENVEESPKLESFADVEIKHGLFQLSEALAFLHNDAKIFHGNICPASIVINSRGAWKLSGFEFCVLGSPNPAGKTTFEAKEYDRGAMSVMQPTLDYAAPELINGSKCDVYVDIFSLGMLGASLFNSCKPVLPSKGMLDTYRTKMDAMNRGSISDTLWFKHVPQIFGSDLKACLHQTPELRPDAYQLTKIGYFDDPALKTLNYLESLMQMDNSQKMTFFKGLPQILDKFSNRPLLQKIMPCLADEFNNPELVPFVLPSIFFIAEQVDNNEFSTQVFPSLLPVFRLQKPYQIVLLLLQKMPLLLKKTPENDIKKHVLPLIYNSVCNENPRIQELCLSIVPTVGKLIDRDAMKTQLLPKLIKLVLEGSVLSLARSSLVMLGQIITQSRTMDGKRSNSAGAAKNQQSRAGNIDGRFWASSNWHMKTNVLASAENNVQKLYCRF